MATIQAAVFDLDDTLYLERDYVRSAYRAVGEHLRRNLHRGDPFEDWLWRRFLSGATAGAMDELNEHFSLGLGPGQIGELVQAYRDHQPMIHPLGGMAQMLGRLHEHYRLGLLGDGFLPAQRLKLQALGLERFFDEVTFTEELGRDAWKPSTKGFELISRRLEVPHEACAYVADDVAKDFIAPNSLGWRTIQYVCPGQVHISPVAAAAKAKPQRIARDLQELRDALRA